MHPHGKNDKTEPRCESQQTNAGFQRLWSNFGVLLSFLLGFPLSYTTPLGIFVENPVLLLRFMHIYEWGLEMPMVEHVVACEVLLSAKKEDGPFSPPCLSFSVATRKGEEPGAPSCVAVNKSCALYDVVFFLYCCCVIQATSGCCTSRQVGQGIHIHTPNGFSEATST